MSAGANSVFSSSGSEFFSTNRSGVLGGPALGMGHFGFDLHGCGNRPTVATVDRLYRGHRGLDCGVGGKE